MKEILIFGGLTIAVIAGVALHYSWVSKNSPVEQDLDITAEVDTATTTMNHDNNNEITGLLIEDALEGNGAEAENGKSVSVHYTGTLLDGSKFDSSVDRGTPFEFILGSGQVIEGWDKGVLGMKVGGKRKLTIPAEMAYGGSARPGIPANSTLVFDIELLGVK